MSIPTTSSASSGISRRTFLRTTTAAAAAFPLLAPARLFGAAAPGNRIRVGQIGCGRIGRTHDMPEVLKSGLADIVAVCDVDSRRAADGKVLVEEFYRGKEMPAPHVAVFADYRELLSHPGVDVIVISAPDHWHAEIAVAAAQAGKDIYLQKPMAMTLLESIRVRDAVRKARVILQVGSQQRSSQQFRRASELVRSGRVGRLQQVEIGLPIDDTAPDQPEQPVPPNLDYDRWLGCTPKVFYTEQRVHPQKNYDRPGWMRNESYCLGMITNWGAHHFDIAHWGMDMEDSGPIQVEGRADFPSNRIWNVHGHFDVHLVYPGNIRMHVSSKFPNGVRFVGDEGWIFVSRETQTPESGLPRPVLRSLDASDPKLLEPAGVKELYRSANQHRNWLECVRSRQAPVAPVDVGHRSFSACYVSWVAMKLGRTLSWNPQRERFERDDAANSMLARPERAPYGAGRLVRA